MLFRHLRGLIGMPKQVYCWGLYMLTINMMSTGGWAVSANFTVQTSPIEIITGAT